MKKRIMMFLVIFFSVTTVALANNLEKVAREAIKAYQTKDVEMLKKNVVGIFKMVVTDDYFEKKSSQKFMDAVNNWDGNFKEIRYQSANMAGTKMYSALAYFADHPSDPDKIFAVALSSKDEELWTLFSDGLLIESKEEFEKFNKDLKSVKKQGSSKPKVQKKFSMEMANGETSDNVTEKMLKEGISSLDEDNFFLILKNKDDFIQVAYSDQGYDVQYKENGKQYVAREYLTLDQAQRAFVSYFNSQDDWKDLTPWDDMS